MWFITLIVLYVGLLITNVILRKASFIPIKLIVALSLVIPFVWLTTSPPYPLVAGSALTTSFLLIIVGSFLIFIFGAFRRQTEITRDMAGGFSANTEGSRWFWQNGNDVDDERQRRTNGRDREIRLRNYRAKMHRALNPDEENNNRRR